MNRMIIKYGLRLLVSTFIYLFFRINSGHIDANLHCDFSIWPILLLFTIVVVLSVWEVCDKVINYYANNHPVYLTSNRKLVMIFILATLACFPLVTGYLYFENYYLKVWLNSVIDPEREFYANITKSYVVTWLVISVQILKVYHKTMRNMEVEQSRMQKELMRTQFESLKNQVSPHFLFNNFSVLDALIHKDSELASEYLAQLSKLYRYILDNKESEMVSLAKEIELLDSYLFLLKIRHDNCIKLEYQIKIDTLGFFVPTLSLQMLIENAVKHNSFSKEKPLKIKIFNEDDQFIIIQNQVNLKTGITNSTKIGLDNIKSRYDLKSDKQVVIYQSEEVFKVKLPMLSSLTLT